MIDQGTTPEPTRWSVAAALMAAMFTVAVGYGVVLPILPFTIERLAENGNAATISRHTGLLTGTYTLALFLFAPVSGRMSDRLGRRPLILFGLIGFALTLVLFGLASRLPLLYLSRFLNGLFTAAVTPAAYAFVGDLALSRRARAHWFALLNVATTAGFLVGPLIGGLVLGAARTLTPGLSITTVPAPFLATAAFALFVIPVAWRLLPVAPRRFSSPAAAEIRREYRAVRTRLFAIALVTAAAVGAFEVALSLLGKETLGFDAYRIGMMFTECSLIMFVAQGLVFSPLVKPEATRWLIVPGLSALAVGLVAVPFATGYLALVFAVGLIAASAGILSPITTYWISLGADERQGTELGLQTAAASLGQALGSAAGGLLFDAAILPGASFIVPAAAVVAGLVAASGLPRLLVRTLQAKVAAPQPAAATHFSSEAAGARERSP